METPSSRRITRSQAKAMSSILGSENEESLKGGLKSRSKTGKNQVKENKALIDITNGSPIVGLAMGSLKTPLSTCCKKRITAPGSGESLLRGQVKTLLQKVEEEGGVISKVHFEPKSFNYPMGIFTSTPANTPQFYDFSDSNNKGFESFAVSPVAENFNFTQMLNEIIASPNQEAKRESESDEKNVITRSLLIDFSEGSSDSSLWSVKVNASTSDEYKDDLEEDYDHVVVDDLCEGMSQISLNKFSGKHKRFVYNSDGELEGELLDSLSSKTANIKTGEAFK
ncbi:uncharacterized protein [Rutidosis leptorrhynchoides]|uniref:uncharacterized protein n=1 Tax=Rutidosis leptorrhynchoides TaxID=125765 RepID=UPI003A998E2F